jgi:aspartate aminotransferase-like enzyme
MHRPAINHRGGEFAELLRANIEGLQRIMQTKNDVLIFPGSGSGGLEAAVVNVLSPGDKVVAFNMGVFSDRFGVIARNFGAEVTTIDVEWGQAVTAGQLREVLAPDTAHTYKAILITHNETATCVTTELASIRAMLDELGHPAMFMVDAVSSLAINDLPTDELRIDVLVSASQKGLMLPGGLAIIAVSKKAWEAHKTATMPKWYWNFTAVKNRSAVGQMPYTPAISLFFGLRESLRLLEEEGLPNVLARHASNADAVRRGVQELGLELLVKNPAEQSNAVTAVMLPEGVAYEDLARSMEEMGVVIGGGLQRLEGKIFRIGHLGMLHMADVEVILGVLREALERLGWDGVATA